MNPRMESLSRMLATFLERKSVPMNLQGKPNAQAAEVNAILHAVIRFAPKAGYEEWWERMEVALGERSKTRGWPTEGEIKDAALSMAPTAKSGAAYQEWEADSHEVMARKIKAGDSVGDAYIYGRCAAEMVSRGMVTDSDLRPYRSSLYFSAKSVYGEDEARRMEAGWIARHDAACRLWAGPPPEPPRGEPFNRMTAHAWD